MRRAVNIRCTQQVRQRLRKLGVAGRSARDTLFGLVCILSFSLTIAVSAEPPSQRKRGSTDGHQAGECEPTRHDEVNTDRSCLGLPRIGDSTASVTPSSPSTQRRPITMSQSESSATEDKRPKSPRGSLNVLGEPLRQCCTSPMTGFERDGYCHTGPHDRGVHVVCAQMTEAFLDYTRSRGNDLSTPLPQYGFPGLKPGDRWCLCAARWAEAERAGVAPPVDLAATHIGALRIVPLEKLKSYQISRD